MLGAAIAFGLESALYNTLVNWMSGMSINFIKLVPFRELLVPMIVTFSAAGLFVGIIGSWTSIRKFMNV